MPTNPLAVARAFGRYLDADDFSNLATILAPDCSYNTGKATLNGREAICSSYQTNMEQGRQKLDELIWGDSRVEPVSETEFAIYFTDHLRHKGKSHTYRCRQVVTVNGGNLISHIRHEELDGERENLETFYQNTGLL